MTTAKSCTQFAICPTNTCSGFIMQWFFKSHWQQQPDRHSGGAILSLAMETCRKKSVVCSFRPLITRKEKRRRENRRQRRKKESKEKVTFRRFRVKIPVALEHSLREQCISGSGVFEAIFRENCEQKVSQPSRPQNISEDTFRFA